ncbi:hypothetical protein [Scleromatobacter humisilvae]|uniref:Uncharacterized protein n=1 Tax=Scleromatobacter humisilvae TaxID=2897159 RepID=A0A9X1YNN2_9BURK|nr:hypothetical protein [Scleromatobacter humisilvae]MCK9689142.1 hypothetical protein [Scleromatobacter humisilvae]
MSPIAKSVATALLSLASAVAVADPAVIADAYDLHDVNDADAADAMARCLGDGAGGVKDFIATHARLGDRTRSELEARTGGPGAVVAAGPFWACVAFSPEGFPAWPVEALGGAITVRGVDPSVQAEWARKVLAQVAHEGEGRGLVILSNGDGVQFNVIAEDHKASLLHYTSRKILKDEIDRTRFAAVIDDPKFSGMSTTRIGTPNDAVLSAVFALPDARLRKPTDGEYVHERADDATARFDFTGTRWQFGKGLDAVLELQADGQAVETSKANNVERKTPGSWRVEGGVLHIALGAARFSMVLDGSRTLTGDARRKLFPGEAAPDADHDGDLRWSLTLKRAGWW